MRLIYTTGIYLYTLLLRFAALFVPKAHLWVNGRKHYFSRIKDQKPENCWWFHCASLGEFDMALPVINQLKTEHPEIQVLVTFFSPSGMQHFHKRKHLADLVLYLPADTPSNARKFLAHFQPKAAVFVKYEFWSNYIFTAKKQEIPVLSMCTLLRPEQRFFKWYGGFFRKTLQQISFFYPQNKETAKLLESISIDNYLITGDTRYDRVIENKLQLDHNPRIEAFLKNQKAFIIGSSWPDDEAILLPFIQNHPELQFIIAPHNIDEKHVAAIELVLGNSCERYTNAPKDNTHVLILNTIGHLASAYSYGSVAYVGGGFSGSLHNILEPAVFGLPVLFGPKFSRFPEAGQFIQRKIGFSVSTTEQLEANYQFIAKNMKQLSKDTSSMVEENTGAAKKIVQDMENRFF